MYLTQKISQPDNLYPSDAIHVSIYPPHVTSFVHSELRKHNEHPRGPSAVMSANCSQSGGAAKTNVVLRSGYSANTVLHLRGRASQAITKSRSGKNESIHLERLRCRVSFFGSLLEYFLTPEREYPQLGCHLSSIIPPLPG